MIQSAKERDAYFTKPNVARECVKTLDSIIGLNHTYLEPSAGEGAFVTPLDGRRVTALDICPQSQLVTLGNFLDTDVTATVVLGNPPFGKRAKLAVEFINKAARFAEYIAFILPVQFRKYFTQKQLDPTLSLIFDQTLPPDSFLLEGKDYKVRCCYQIWTTGQSDVNFRLLKPQPTSHPDFKMWLYNNVPAAVQVFDNEFDFAVPRQGYQDYNLRACVDECVLTKQWMLFKASTPEVLQRLTNLDFVKLSQLNTSTPGYGKADVVAEYTRLYN